METAFVDDAAYDQLTSLIVRLDFQVVSRQIGNAAVQRPSESPVLIKIRGAVAR